MASLIPPCVIIGSIAIDLTVRAKRIPQLGATAPCENFEYSSGGKGANQAAACARLYSAQKMKAPILIGYLGQDYFGDFVLNDLKESGVNCDYVKKSKNNPTGTAVILVETDLGDNRICCFRGANSDNSKDDILNYSDIISNASIVLVQLEIPIEPVMEAIKIASRKGVPVIFNPAPAVDDLPIEMLQLCDYVIPNETELSILIGSKEPPSDVEEAIQMLTQFNKKIHANNENCKTIVIVTLGSKGVIYTDKESQTICHVPAVPVKAVDSTAAGDSFLGSFAVSVSEGMSLKEAIRKSVLVASIAVTREGAQKSIPTRAEVDQSVQSFCA